MAYSKYFSKSWKGSRVNEKRNRCFDKWRGYAAKVAISPYYFRGCLKFIVDVRAKVKSYY